MIQSSYITTAIARTETYDFLIDTIPKDELIHHVSPEFLVSVNYHFLTLSLFGHLSELATKLRSATYASLKSRIWHRTARR